MKIREKSYLFLKIDEENGGFGRGRGRQYKVCARDIRENWKVFENRLRFNPICAKHTIFATQLTREQVVKMSHQNPLNKILKILSKSFSRLEGLPASESQNLLCKLETRASTCNQVAKMSCENDQNPEILKNILSVFRDWGIHLPGNCESFWVSSRLAWPMSESPKKSCKNFGFSENFQNKTLSKNN